MPGLESCLRALIYYYDLLRPDLGDGIHDRYDRSGNVPVRRMRNELRIIAFYLRDQPIAR